MAGNCNSIVSLRELPFSRRSNADKLAVKELGPPRPNLNIKQVSTKAGKTYSRGFSRSWYERKTWLAGCEVAKAKKKVEILTKSVIYLASDVGLLLF